MKGLGRKNTLTVSLLCAYLAIPRQYFHTEAIHRGGWAGHEKCGEKIYSTPDSKHPRSTSDPPQRAALLTYYETEALGVY